MKTSTKKMISDFYADIEQDLLDAACAYEGNVAKLMRDKLPSDTHIRALILGGLAEHGHIPDADTIHQRIANP